MSKIDKVWELVLSGAIVFGSIYLGTQEVLTQWALVFAMSVGLFIFDAETISSKVVELLKVKYGSDN